MARSKEVYVSSTDNECEVCLADIWSDDSFGYVDGRLACYPCWAGEDEDEEDWDDIG